MRRTLRGSGACDYEIYPAAQCRAGDVPVCICSATEAEQFFRDLSQDSANALALRDALFEILNQSLNLNTEAIVVRLASAMMRGTVRMSFLPRTAPSMVEDALPVIDYIVAEMNRNAHGADARQILRHNQFDAVVCLRDWQNLPMWQQLLTYATPQQCNDMQMASTTAALTGWALNVRQDGPWDHKPYIRRTFNPRNPPREQTWHRLGPSDYYYDIWSNVHYGYVGAACGFDDSTLLDGAGLEQIGSTLLRGSWPSRSPDVSGLRAFDDPSDRASIAIGIQLYRTYPQQVTAAQIRAAVEASREVTKRPYEALAESRAAAGR